MTTPPSPPMPRPARTSGERRSWRSISGAATLRALTTKATSSTTEPASIAMTSGEVQPNSWPPSDTANRRSRIDPVSRPAPSQSMGWEWRSNRSWKANQMIAPARMPTGRLISNTQGHPTVVVITPPSAGPMIADTPQTPENTPCIRARWRGVKMSPAMVNETGWTAPAPRPWSARNPMRAGMDVAVPHRTDPITNSASPTRNTGLRPWMSASRAKSRHGRRGRDEVRGEHPRVLGQPAELPDDRRHGGPDDGRVESGDGNGGHDPGRHDQLVAGQRCIEVVGRRGKHPGSLRAFSRLSSHGRRIRTHLGGPSRLTGPPEPIEHAQRAQRVPPARRALADLHLEVDRARVNVLERPAAIRGAHPLHEAERLEGSASSSQAITVTRASDATRRRPSRWSRPTSRPRSARRRCCQDRAGTRARPTPCMSAAARASAPPSSTPRRIRRSTSATPTTMLQPITGAPSAGRGPRRWARPPLMPWPAVPATLPTAPSPVAIDQYGTHRTG